MGRYNLVDKLGQGSMGVVYKAHDEVLGRDVALKTMAGDMDASDTLRTRFYQEARLAANLNHPHIIRVFDLGEIDGQIYIAMELLEGRDLKAILKESAPIPLEKKLAWMVEITEALAFAHRASIIHRDIKPGNIHIRPSGEAVIMDFGIARAGASTITKSGTIIGSPEYVAPEQIMRAHADHRADIFSLGVVFYELLTLQHPFRSPDMATTINRVVNEKPPEPQEINQLIPDKLGDLVMKAMDKDLNSRYQNCEELLQGLEECRSNLNSQVREMIAAKDRIDSEILICVGKLRDLYPPPDFVRICREVGFDPTAGFLPETQAPDFPTFSQAADALTQTEKRLTAAKQYLETAPQLESILQAGKAFFAAHRYSECINQMKTILAYCPGHELAQEYIQQSGIRLKEIEDADKDRRWTIETEQKVMTLFKSGNTDAARQEAHRLKVVDPGNKIAKKYLTQQQPNWWTQLISNIKYQIAKNRGNK